MHSPRGSRATRIWSGLAGTFHGIRQKKGRGIAHHVETRPNGDSSLIEELAPVTELRPAGARQRDLWGRAAGGASGAWVRL
jgi:hypothetical protein